MQATHVEFFEDGADVGLRSNAGEDAELQFSDEGRVSGVDKEVEQERLEHCLCMS